MNQVKGLPILSIPKGIKDSSACTWNKSRNKSRYKQSLNPFRDDILYIYVLKRSDKGIGRAKRRYMWYGSPVTSNEERKGLGGSAIGNNWGKTSHHSRLTHIKSLA